MRSEVADVGLCDTSSVPRLRRVAGTAAGFAMAAAIMCASQPAFAAGHHQAATRHTTSASAKSKTAKTASTKAKSKAGKASEANQHTATKHNDSNTERARSADCPGRGDHDRTPHTGKSGSGKSHDGKSKQQREKEAREKAARERAAERARKAAEQKAAEQKAAEQKAAAEQAAAEQQVEQQRAAQIQAARLLKATHALNVVHQQAVQLKTAQLQATAAAVKAVNAAHASAVQLAALGTPISITDAQQVADLTTLTRSTVNAPAQNTQAPARAAQPTKAKAVPKREPVAAPRPIADDPILAIPTMIVAAGLSVGAAPEILLALVLFSGLGLVVIGTYRRKTSRAG
jgi:hypothetical protein